MRKTFLILASLWGAVTATHASARDPEEFQYLGETSGTAIRTSVATRQTVADESLPPWLKSALAEQIVTLHDTPCQRRQNLVFQQSGRPTFVATTWSCGDVYRGYLTIHRVSDGNRLSLESSRDGGKFTIVEPSGSEVLPNDAAALFVDEASGGSGYEGYRQHIFRLASKVEDVTPPLRTVWAENIEGKLLVMSSDDRWANFFSGCGQCGPLIPVISVWKDGHLGPACRQYPSLIEARLRDFSQYAAAAEAKGAPPLQVAEYKLNIALLLLQLGRGAEGRAAYESTLVWLQQKGAETGMEADRSRRDWSKRLEDALGPTIAEASQLTDQQCPLTAAHGSDNHPGYKARVDSFRPKNNRP